MRPNVAANLRMWDQSYAWPLDGDEWQGQAELCGIPYAEWKASLVAHLIAPYCGAAATVLEIAPGHGRWTEHVADAAALVIAVDLSPSCLAFCRDRLRDRRNIEYRLTDGETLPPEAKGRVDMVFSYDAFVHMDADVIAAYLREMRRVLVAGGRAIIHHADVPDPATHVQDEHPGWRSAMSAALFARLAREAGLRVERQLTYWEEERRIGVPRFGDVISVVARP